MDDLQYNSGIVFATLTARNGSFKPCYKWMTFNTMQIGSTMKKANAF